MSDLIREIPFASNDVEKAGFLNKDVAKAAGKLIVSGWKDYLDTFAPRGITAHGKAGSPDDINDAYRHYMSAALLTQMNKPHLGQKFAGRLTLALGDLNELINDTYSAQSNEIDYANNDAGNAAGIRTSYGFDASMAFVTDVAAGQVTVVNKSTGVVRESNVRDLPEVAEPYQRDKSPDDFSGGNPGTMDA